MVVCQPHIDEDIIIQVEKAGKAAIQLEGKFIDYPVVEKSRRIVEMAKTIEES